MKNSKKQSKPHEYHKLYKRCFENGFTPNMAVIYSMIKEWNISTGKDFTLSSRTIANKININYKTVQRVLKKLIEEDIITRNLDINNKPKLRCNELL